jgi:Rrf2 family protein
MLQLAILSQSTPERYFTATDLAESLNIPSPLFSKVLNQLADADLIESRKGPSGGVRLHRPPEEIRIIEIVHALDGKDALNKCIMGFRECSSKSPCPMHEYWGTQRRELQQKLSNTSLANWSTLENNRILALHDGI